MAKRAFLIVFILISIAELSAVIMDAPYRHITKPLVMISLITYFIIEAQSVKWDKPKIIFFIALVFALAGDVFLLFEGKFILGLASFLMMQVLYTWSFSFGKKYVGRRELIFFAFLAIILILTNGALWAYVGDLRVPVLVYTLAITVMAGMAYVRDYTQSGYQLLVVGSVFFIISDTVLAIREFHPDITLPGWWVMLTYIIAQYMIVSGYLKFLKPQS